MKFEKVSREQFNKTSDCGYENIVIPKRATKGSAGYDFFTPVDFIVRANSQTPLIPTGIRCKIDKGNVLLLFVRSSIGIKKQCTLSNGTGIIDEDYYFADNEGHIMFSLKNNSNEDISFKAGDRILQGVFCHYVITDDDDVDIKRTGGFGSTN